MSSTFHQRVPRVLRGSGGRMSMTGKSVVVFGATGFLGKYVVNNLGRTGWTVHIATRGDDMEWRHLKPLCDHGKLIPHYYSPKDEASVERCIPDGEVDVVLNLIGKTYETKHLLPWWINSTFEDTHVHATNTIAKVARKKGVEHFVQMSCAKADLNSSSAWARTKAQGELEAMKEFPGATIVRSGKLFGEDDVFLNNVADHLRSGHITRLPDEGKAEIYPTFVKNVGEALVPILFKPDEFAGETVHLLGKDKFTLKQMYEYVDQTIGMNTDRIYVSYDRNSPFVKMYGKLNDMIPGPTYSTDQIEQLCLSDQPLSQGELSWDSVDIEPDVFDEKAYNALYRYRKGGHFRELRALELGLGQGHVSHKIGQTGVVKKDL